MGNLIWSQCKLLESFLSSWSSNIEQCVRLKIICKTAALSTLDHRRTIENNWDYQVIELQAQNFPLWSLAVSVCLQRKKIAKFQKFRLYVWSTDEQVDILSIRIEFSKLIQVKEADCSWWFTMLIYSLDSTLLDSVYFDPNCLAMLVYRAAL